MTVGFPSDSKDYTAFHHSDGAVHINLTYVHDPSKIIARLTTHSQIMQLFMLTDAIRRSYKIKSLSLYLPYFPYARADRVMPGGGGDALGVKVMADLINLQKYETVHVLDPHSTVLPAVLDHCVVHTPIPLIDRAIHGRNNVIFISPDAGAEKKIFEYAKFFNKPVVRASKHREVTTGQITGVSLLDPLPPDATAIVIDDICDGGRTFEELAQVLPVNQRVLCVTHGIFSKGIAKLAELYSDIYTTNSIRDRDEILGPSPSPASSLTVMEVTECML